MNTTFTTWINENPLRKHITQAIFVLIALALLAKTVMLFRQASQVGVAEFSPQTVYVTGKAEEYVKPDTMVFTVTVSEEGKDVAEATTKASDKINKAIESLKANGVDEKNIKTTFYMASDKYENVSTPCPVAQPTYIPSVKYVTAPTPDVVYTTPACTNTSANVVGASVSQSIEVKIKDIEKNATTDKRSKIIGDLAAVGAKAEGVSFVVFDIDVVKARLRAEAIKNAKEDARKLAQQLGVNMGNIVGFYDNSDAGGFGPYMSARAEGSAMDKAVSGPTLPTGEQKIVANVSLTYLLK